MKTTVTAMILLATAIAVQGAAPKPPKPQPDCSLYDPACPIILDGKAHQQSLSDVLNAIKVGIYAVIWGT